jgi:energy-coupling factor transporter ATP-binding protein EcfA2
MPTEALVRLQGWSLRRNGPEGERTLLEGIDLEVPPGSWVALLGANGSGKSSLLKWLASDESPVGDRCAIMFQDPDDQLVAPTVARELGLGRPGLDAAAAAAGVGLDGLLDLDPRLLGAGQKQRLVLAVAEGGGPDLLLCDEPTALQDDRQAAWVLDRLDAWRRKPGRALLTATCDRAEAARADHLVVLENGRIAVQGPAQALLADPRLAALLDPGFTPGPVRSGGGEPVLDAQGLGFRFMGGAGCGPLDLAARPGERVGLVGPNGSGKSSILAALAGLRAPDRGWIRVAGRLLAAGRVPDLEHGLVMLAPQFPEYAFCRPTVAREMALDPALAGLDAGRWLEGLGLPAGAAGANPHDLSTGQRRRLALGLALESRRPLILLDEPTAALDAAGRRLVLDLLDRAPAESALVIASHDRAFLEAAGCRIVALAGGAEAD